MGRALVRDPKIFLFDEPLSNLDAKLRVDMRTEIKQLHQRLKATIVYVTHDQIEAMTLATQIAVHEGRRAAAVRHAGGNLQQPRQHVRRRVHGLAGDEPDPGHDRSRRMAVRSRSAMTRGEGGPAQPAAAPMAAASRRYAGQQVIFGIRPEAITDRDGADRHMRRAVAHRRVPWSRSSSRPGRTRFAVTHARRQARSTGAPARRRQRPRPAQVCRLRVQPEQGGVSSIRQEPRTAIALT